LQFLSRIFPLSAVAFPLRSKSSNNASIGARKQIPSSIPKSSNNYFSTTYKHTIFYLEMVFKKWYWMLYNIQFTLCNVYNTMYTDQCTLHNVYYTMYITQCTLTNVHYTMYTIQCTLTSVHYKMYTDQCTLQNVHCPVYTTSFSLLQNNHSDF